MPSHQEFYERLSNISVNADTLNLNTDQVETKLDTANGILTTLSADTALVKDDIANGVTSLGTKGSITTRSGTITTGGTSQQVAASNSSRVYFAIQNISDTDMYLGVGFTPTTTTGILLSKSGGGFVFESGFIPTQAINILCATTGKAFVAWES